MTEKVKIAARNLAILLVVALPVWILGMFLGQWLVDGPGEGSLGSAVLYYLLTLGVPTLAAGVVHQTVVAVVAGMLNRTALRWVSWGLLLLVPAAQLVSGTTAGVLISWVVWLPLLASLVVFALLQRLPIAARS